MDDEGSIHTSNPYDLINSFVIVGKELEVNQQKIDDQTLISELNSLINIDSLQTSHLSLSEFQNAIDNLRIRPLDYFEVTNVTGTVGLQLIIPNIVTIRRAYTLYQTYRDPRIRDPDILNAEMILESILKEAKFEAMQSNSKRIQIPLNKIRLPSSIRVSKTSDLPKLEWQRDEADIHLAYHVLLRSIVAILRKGLMINPELIRLLNLVPKDTLDSIFGEMTIFDKSRVIVALQRLADIMYLTNFGILDQTIHFHLIEDMFDNPLEERTNLPQSEAKDAIVFLNKLRQLFPEVDDLVQLSRRIGILTKPVSGEPVNFIGFNSSGDAIREILSVIHYSMNNQDIATQIQTIYETLTDPSFTEVMRYYFDPTYELLHTPFITIIQSTIERMEAHVYGRFITDTTITKHQIEEIKEIQANIIEYLQSNPGTKQYIDIWQNINKFLKIDVKTQISKKSKLEVYELIKGKTILLNIMTPLLLAKYEGRGYNPLATTVDTKLESRLKNITGVIAVGSNLSTTDLEALLNTMFIEAPELKSSKPKSGKSSVPSTPPTPKGPPTPGSSPSSSKVGSHLIPTKMGIGLARIANEYVTGGGERNLHKALVDLIQFTKEQNN